MVEKTVLLWEQNTSLRNYSSLSWCSQRSYIMRVPLNQEISVKIEIQMTRPSQIHLFTRSLRNDCEPSNAEIHSIVNNILVCVHCCNSQSTSCLKMCIPFYGNQGLKLEQIHKILIRCVLQIFLRKWDWFRWLNEIETIISKTKMKKSV